MKKVLYFFICSVLVGIGVSYLVSNGLSKNWLNLWPISAGMIGLIFLPKSSLRLKSVYVLVSLAVVSLLIFRGYWPEGKIPINGMLVGLFFIVIYLIKKHPLKSIGLTSNLFNVNNITMAAFLGLGPHIITYIILFFKNSNCLTVNPKWEFLEQPAYGVLSIFTSFFILMLNNIVGEELGWRGYFVNTARGRFSRSSFIWLNVLLFSLWHLPYDILILKMDIVNLLINQASRVLSGLVFFYVFILFDSSVLLVSITHSFSNLFLYNIVSAKGPFSSHFSGIEGLVYVGLYFVSLLVVVVFLKIKTKNKIDLFNTK